jgi:hypothetical protein
MFSVDELRERLPVFLLVPPFEPLAPDLDVVFEPGRLREVFLPGDDCFFICYVLEIIIFLFLWMFEISQPIY